MGSACVHSPTVGSAPGDSTELLPSVRGSAQHVADLAHGRLELTRNLVRPRLAAELLDELALDVNDLVELLDHVDRDPDRPPLVRDCTGDRLADPPRGVRRELVAAPVVELLDGADETHRSLLDEIDERES